MPEPVEACELAWEPVRRWRRSRSRAAWLLAGHGCRRAGARWEQLAGVLKAAFAGEGHRVVLLSGEPGIGKTTLAGDLGRRAHGAGATVLYGRCDDDFGVPYQPFVEALGDFVADAPECVRCP